MTDLIRKAKDRGSQLLTQGKLKPALEQFQMVLAKNPNEISARQKVAEILVKLNRKPEAVEEYTRVSNAYAHAGQFYKSIAICKIILGLDPKHQAAQDTLTSLYSSIREPTTKKAYTGTGMHAAAIRPPPPPPPETEASTSIEIEIAEDVPVVMGDEDVVLISVEAEPPAPPPAEEPGQALPTIPLFSALPPEEFKAILNGAVEAKVYFAGERIVTEGDPGNAMYAIVQGEVGVWRTAEGQEAREVAQMRDGDIFGEIALVSGAPRLASVIAKGETITLEFQRDSMLALVQKHPGIRQALEAFFRERMLANLLRASPVFRMLPDDVKAQIAREFQPQNFNAGDMIVTQGEAGSGVFMLLRGRCEAFDSKSGTKYPDLNEGDYFGEISIMLKRPATANVRAAAAVTALKLPAETFLTKVLALPQITESVVALARERFARSEAAAKISRDDRFDLLV